MKENRVFVSPGVYTSEKDLTFVTSNVGVTSLGIVGETTKGPAFQPIYISNYGEFKTFFGGLNPTKIKDTGALKYELPYIAKSYLNNSNQLFVTRVLGLSGYNAGKGYGILIDGKLVALLRSRASYDGAELLTFKASTVTITGAPTKSEDITIDVDGVTYGVSLDSTKKNYITRVFGRTNDDGKSPLFVEEIYPKVIAGFDSAKLVTLQDFSEDESYLTSYKSAHTPFIVSEVKDSSGSESSISRLFRFQTISDGDTANSEIKFSIVNIKPDDREFDVVIRKFNDTDANPVILERYSKCTMNPNSNNYIGKRIGTTNGDYLAISSHALVEMVDDETNSDSFPAGFEGYPIRGTESDSPNVVYKTSYDTFENKRRNYLGLTPDTDADMFAFKGLGEDAEKNKGFHMDSGAPDASFDKPATITFRSEASVSNTEYEKIEARKFTVAPYGGFDGWDIYRAQRTNTDKYSIQKYSIENSSNMEIIFKTMPLSDGDDGINSDYYAYLEAIRTFSNPESVNINVFTTPGIDTINNPTLVDYTIDMVERERSDSLYIVTTPDMSSGDMMTPKDVANLLEDKFDSNYTATYWPWIQKNDDENNVSVYLSPTCEVVKNIALTDNIAFPWFAFAGFQRGDVNAIQARKNLTQTHRDTLYENRINPIATFSGEGIKIWGNKNLQIKDTALNRINVRRLLLRARKLISAVSIRLVFEQNDDTLRGQFLKKVNPILENIRKERGLTEFQIMLDNISPEGNDRNTLSGRIRIQPTDALEYIDIGFDVTQSGASFEDI